MIQSQGEPEKFFRLHESLFFNPRMAIHGSFQGRTTLNSLLDRWANILIQMLQIDPLKGDMKTLAKYLLQATKGKGLFHQIMLLGQVLQNPICKS